MKSKVVKTIRGADHFIANKNSDVCKEFESILNAINDIDEQKLITEYEASIKESPSLKSLSVILNAVVKKVLNNHDWKSESFIFKDKEYQIKGSVDKPSAWQLDHVKEKISLEVSFNHSQNIPINLIRPTMASEQNHVEKAINTEMAVIVCMSDNLKIAGNFDNAVASTIDWLRYLKPYSQILTAPMAFIEIGPPSSFFIPHGSIIHNSKDDMYRINKIAQAGDKVLLGKTQAKRKPSEKWINNSQQVEIKSYSIIEGEFKIEVIDENGMTNTGFDKKGKWVKYNPTYFSSM